MDNFTQRCLSAYQNGVISALERFEAEAMARGNYGKAASYSKEARQVRERNGPAWERLVKEYRLENFI